jgi:hypothetical protein
MNHSLQFFLALVFTLTICGADQQHKLVISISQPCSLSVAFFRMIWQRGDFATSHEPGVYAWRMIDHPEYIEANEYLTSEYFHEFSTFAGVKQVISSLVEQQNTFVKEECYAAIHYLYDPDFIKANNPDIVFLVRNPHYVLISLYKTLNSLHCNQVPGKKFCVIDYQNMWNLFNYLSSLKIKKPFIVNTDDLSNSPDQVVKQFCNYTEIPFKHESLQWEDLSNKFSNDRIWYDNPYARFDTIWHGKALSSTCFVQNTPSYHLDDNGNPTFEEIEDTNIRTTYLKLYEEMLPYYNLFMEEHQKQQNAYAKSSQTQS